MPHIHIREYNMPNPVLKNLEGGDLIEVTKSPFVLGRGLFCDYTILNRVISRSHCQIEKSGLNWVLTDLSTNGTMVNNQLYISNASTILKNNDEICLSYQTYTYKFLLEPPEVPNNDQVHRLMVEQENISPPSPNSFDENGVSDDFLNNIADNILFDEPEAVRPKKFAAIQDSSLVCVAPEEPCNGQDIEIKQEEAFNPSKAQLNPGPVAISVDQSRMGGKTQPELLKVNFNNLVQQLHPLTDTTNTNPRTSNSNCGNILSSIIQSLPESITTEAAIEISSDEEHMNDDAEGGGSTAPRSTYSKTFEDVVMKGCEQTDNSPSTSILQMSPMNKPTASPPSSYSQILHKIVHKYTNSIPSISSIRIMSPQNGNKRLKITARASTSLHEAGPSRVLPKILDITSTIKEETVMTVNQNQMRHVLPNTATEVAPEIIQISSNAPEMWEQPDQNAANGTSQKAEAKLKEASASKTIPKQQPSKLQDQHQFEEMENELMCTICANLFIKAVTLGCSHSFCMHCIQMWKKNKSDCPICRKKITSQNNTLVLDNLVEKMIDNAPEEEKQQRKEAIEERNKIAEKQASATKKTAGRTSGRRGRRRTSNRNNNNNNNDNITAPLVIQIPPVPVPGVLPVINLDELSSIDSEDSDYYNYADYDGTDWYDGVYENAYYGGYGRCYNCGLQGHWSNGCPYR